MTKKPAPRITAADIEAALARIYSQPEWAILFDVGNATGGRATRRADAVAMSLWPSRGLELYGFEIKVSRADWRREAKDPSKAEAVAAYCDRWYIAAPPDIVPTEELPPAWGLMEWSGKRWTTKREAARTDAKTIDRNFLAGLLRRAGKTEDARLNAEIDRRRSKAVAEMNETIERKVAMRTTELLRIKGAVAEFEKKAGVKLESWTADSLGEAARLMKLLGLSGMYESAERQAESMESRARDIRAAIETFQIKPDPAAELRLHLDKGTGS